MHPSDLSAGSRASRHYRYGARCLKRNSFSVGVMGNLDCSRIVSDMRRHEDNFMTAEADLVSDFRR